MAMYSKNNNNSSKIQKNKKKKKQSGRPSKKLPKGKYSALKTSVNDITIKDIDNIAGTIEEHCFQKEACILNGICPDAINRLLVTKANKDNSLGSYAANAFKVAQAKSYKTLTEEWLHKDSSAAQKKNLQDFLLLTAPSYSKRHRKEMDYNIELILDAVEHFTDNETYLKILEYIKSTDTEATLKEYDINKVGD